MRCWCIAWQVVLGLGEVLRALSGGAEVSGGWHTDRHDPLFLWFHRTTGDLFGSDRFLIIEGLLRWMFVLRASSFFFYTAVIRIKVTRTYSCTAVGVQLRAVHGTR